MTNKQATKQAIYIKAIIAILTQPKVYEADIAYAKILLDEIAS